MRQDAEFFGEAELDLLYMSPKLREALRLEELLTAAGFDYLVETGTYSSGFIIRRELTGAYFYIAPGDVVRAREVLTENRFKPYQES